MGETHYEFGAFRLDPSERRLLLEETPIALAPKAFELLVTLISNHGHLVTRETLMQTVWPDSFVEEGNLTVNISLLRKILGNTPDGQPWIATVPKCGYRFDGPVKVLSGENGAASRHGPVATEEEPTASTVMEIPPPEVEVAPDESSPHQSAYRYKWIFLFGAIAAIVLSVVVGVRILGARHLAQQGSMQNGAAAPGTASAAAPDTQNAQARELYLQGRADWNKRSMESVEKSIELFGQATALDPKYAAAWSGLADAWILAGSYGNSFLAPSVAMPKAKEAAEKALALDDSSAEAHNSLAYIHLTWDWDFPSAEKEFKRAIAIDPKYVNAHHWYSHELMALGRISESHEESEIALSLDPANVLINEHMAWHHMMAREYDRSIPQATKAIELDPNFVQAHRVLGLDLLYSGRGREACAEFEKGVTLSNGDPVARAYLARCYALTRREAEAREIVADLVKSAAERYISAAEIAAVYAALNDSAQAFQWLNRACQERSGALIYLDADRVWDPLRKDPRFMAVIKQVNLPARADEYVQ